jgi:hypothetical protein
MIINLKRIEYGEPVPKNCIRRRYAKTMGNPFSDEKSARAIFNRHIGIGDDMSHTVIEIINPIFQGNKLICCYVMQ